MTDDVLIVSGGMDSTVMAYLARAEGRTATLVSFDYGQRHHTELDHAAITADALDLEHHVVDLTALGIFLTSALTDRRVDVPDGHYAEESMRATVVPNRNAIMLSIAWGIAQAQDAHRVGTGVHAGDHFIYPDCRPAFVWSINATLRIATDGFADVTLWTPFLDIPKDEIVRIGDQLGVPWVDTWSCYKGNDIHCGACGTCFERREAFILAGVDDPTEYMERPVYAAP